MGDEYICELGHTHAIDDPADECRSDHTQYVMTAAGGLEPDTAGPRTWDGEPIYSAETVQEGLFDTDAFRQMQGQTSMDVDNSAEAVEARRDMFRGFGWSVS